MDDISRLSEAFQSFTTASRTLEEQYEKLRERIRYLTNEVETKNRQLETALAKTEETKDYLRCVLESMDEAILVFDNEKTVTMINRAAEALLAVEASSVTGRTADELEFTVKQEGAETILNSGSGRFSVIMSVSVVRDAAGTERGHVVLFRDVTRLKELESRNERNHRLIAMGEMAAKIVHEVRSPLCSIELYASMLSRELEGGSHAGLAKGISTGISSLNTILTNMLFFAKPQRPLFRDVDLAGTMGEALFMLKPLMESRGIRLENGICEVPCIRGDAELLKQVFLNILMNSIQVTPGGRTIRVSVRSSDEGTVVSIADEGEGIDAGDLEKIFDPFFSTKEKGTGLGLTIASKIMIAHGGMIRVRSERGTGSTFFLSFPKASEEAGEKVLPGKEIFS